MNRDEYADLPDLFHIVSRMYRNSIKKVFTANGLDELSSPKILYILRHYAHNMTLSQKEIADIVGIAPPTVAVSIKRMEKTGLLQKIPDKNDLRRNCVTITEKGLDLLKKYEKSRDEITKCMFADFSDHELNAIREILIKMAGNMENFEVRAPAINMTALADKSPAIDVKYR